MIAIFHHQSTGITDKSTMALKEDLKQIFFHLFGGNHDNCPTYLCSEQSEVNYIPLLQTHKLYEPVFSAIQGLVRNSYSLIYNYNNNLAEGYNSILAKYIAGKRINYTGAGGYEARCCMAAVAMNSAMPVTEYYKHTYNSSPSCHSKALELKLEEQRRNRPKETRKTFPRKALPDKVSTRTYVSYLLNLYFSNNTDKSYG